MNTPNRRHILASSAGLTLAALAAERAQAAATPPGVAPTPTAKSPRETMRLDLGWRFHLGHASDPERISTSGPSSPGSPRRGHGTGRRRR